jgi:N-acylglucosamine 2-epimerase
MNLSQLHSDAKKELLDNVLPFWVNYGIDEENGGFICGLGHKGNCVDSTKYSWYQGRGAWIFAKLYARTNDEKHLNIARKALKFVKQHCIQKDNKFFYTIVSRDGEILKDRTQPDVVGYASLFYAEGLQQVALHETTDKRKSMLEETYQLCQRFLSNCNKNRNAPENSYLLSKPYQKGTRTLGHQMIPLHLATQVLVNHIEILTEEQRLYFEQVAKDMVHNITIKFFDLETKLTREELSYNFEPLNDPVLYYLGHAIEAYWFVMAEAERIDDGDLLELACNRIKRHVECAWDPVFGGLNRGLTISSKKVKVKEDHNDKLLMDKVAWVEQEGLIALLMIRERTKRKEMKIWASEWFEKLHVWVMEHFPLKKHGYDLWLVGGDRRATFQDNYTFGNAGLKSRKENYHHPRYLMAVMEEYERSKEGGKGPKEKHERGSVLVMILIVLVLSTLYDLILKTGVTEQDDGVEASAIDSGEL